MTTTFAAYNIRTDKALKERSVSAYNKPAAEEPCEANNWGLPTYKYNSYVNIETNPEYFAALDEAIAQVERGEVYSFATTEEMFASWDADDAEDEENV